MTLYEIMSFVGATMNNIFYMLDDVEIDGGITVLDIFVALAFLDILLWFVRSILRNNTNNVNKGG